MSVPKRAWNQGQYPSGKESRPRGGWPRLNRKRFLLRVRQVVLMHTIFRSQTTVKPQVDEMCEWDGLIYMLSYMKSKLNAVRSDPDCRRIRFLTAKTPNATLGSSSNAKSNVLEHIVLQAKLDE